MSKSNPWFRLYSEIIEDEKLVLLAFEDRWHYVAVLCLKNKGLLDSEKNKDRLHRKIAAKLGLSESATSELKRRLMDEKLIDANWQPVGWDERQFKNDSSKDRVRKYRERKNKLNENNDIDVCNGDVTLQDRYSNENVTVQETETEADTETEEEKEKKKDMCDFDVFWSHYPKKVAKKSAKKAWEKLKPDKELQGWIINAVNLAKNTKQWKKDGGDYIPMPSTYLNGRRWEDEIGIDTPQSRAQKIANDMEREGRIIEAE